MALEFWHGLNGPGAAKKSDLPLNTLDNPGCLLVRRDGAIIAGSGTSGATMVVSGGPGDDYAAWTDISDSLAGGDPIHGLDET